MLNDFHGLSHLSSEILWGISSSIPLSFVFGIQKCIPIFENRDPTR